jgi:hypothetical protein
LGEATVIDKKKAMDALGQLMKQGQASPEDVAKYQKSVDAGMSYADVIVAELGAETGMRYLQEEFVQALHFLKRKIEFDKVSLPEILLVENSSDEPWHKAKYSLLPGHKKFQEEAAEPWHPSLRGTFAPDPAVSMWFNQHPRFFQDSVKILKTVYQNQPPNEDDLARLTSNR